MSYRELALTFISAHLRAFRKTHDKKPTPTRSNKGFVVGMNRHSNRHTSEEVQDAFKVLMTHVFCNSHDVSHFAAFFIVVGAKTSVAESVDYVILFATLVLADSGTLFNRFVIRMFCLFPIKD